MSSTADASAPASAFPWRACLAVFILALGIRIYFLTLVPGIRMRPDPSWELDSIAISLVTQGRFADPYVVPTGLTAHLPPIPPLLLALVYKVFGLTATAGLVAWLMRAATQAAIWGMLPWIGLRLGLGWQAGLAGGLAGALWPQFIAHGGDLAAVMLGLLVVALVRRWDRIAVAAAEEERAEAEPDREPPGGAAPGPSARASLLLGAGFGVAFHVQPAFLTVFLGYLAFELWKRRDAERWRSAGLVALAAFVVCVPWGVRNYRAFDSVFFVRGNFGLELRMGNHEFATANIDDPHFRGWPPHPRLLREEAIKLRDMGEAGYMRESRQEALQWIRDHPGRFARLTAERIRYFWLGALEDPVMVLCFVGLAALALAGAALLLRSSPWPRSAALLLPLLTYPPVYYLVPWQHRYRFPIEWILFLLAGSAAWTVVASATGKEGQEIGPIGSGKISS